MIHITHYAVRDLHALFPDDERYPAWDVVARASDGTSYYSDDVMDSAEEARAFIDGQCTNPYAFAYWEDKRILPENVRVPDNDWVDVPDEEPEPSGEAAGRAAYIANLSEPERRERALHRALPNLRLNHRNDSRLRHAFEAGWKAAMYEKKEGTTK